MSRRTAIVAVAAALAGGAVVVGNSGAQGPNYVRPGHTSQTDKARATADAAKLLGLLNLPPGATAASSEPAGGGTALARAGSAPATPSLVDLHRWWVVTGDAGQVLAYVEAHPPAGSQKTGWGSGSGPGTQTVNFVTYGWPAVPGILSTRQVVVDVVALGHGRAGVRADAQDIWVTPRPDAERIPAAADHLRVTLLSFGKVKQGPYTFTARAKVHAAAAVIDSLPLFPAGAFSCPADFGFIVRMQFYARGGTAPVAVADDEPGGCSTVGLTVEGHRQPALAGWDVGVKRSATERIERALGLHLDTQPPTQPPA